MDFSAIKNIIFDLGGVILNINFDYTFEAFGKLSGHDLPTMRQKFASLQVFEKYEAGEFDNAYMRDFLRKELNINVSDEEIDRAWNAMLLDFPPERIELVKKLSSKYRLFLLSNTNPIHIDYIDRLLKKEFNMPSLHPLFE